MVSAPAYGAPPVMNRPPQQGGGFPTWAIILIVAIPALIAVVGILAVLSIYGVRKYIGNAKQVEARNSLGQIGKDAVASFENNHRLCPSASAPVPRDESFVSGRKYQSSPADWEIDSARGAGFSCLQFSMSTPQYYQYDYSSTGASFTSVARGDLNGDGAFSRFAHKGQLSGSALLLAPAIEETNPDE